MMENSKKVHLSSLFRRKLAHLSFMASTKILLGEAGYFFMTNSVSDTKTNNNTLSSQLMQKQLNTYSDNAEITNLSKAGYFLLPKQLDCARVEGLKYTIIRFLIILVGDPPLQSITSSSWGCEIMTPYPGSKGNCPQKLKI